MNPEERVKMRRHYTFSKQNKGRTETALDFPRFALEKKGEKARIALFSVEDEGGKKSMVEPRPEGGYFFDLLNPMKEDNPYVGSFECLASEEAKELDQSDPDECPHCEFVVQGVGAGSEPIFRRRRRKFVMPILVYRTNLSGDLMEPFSVDIKAWKFTDRYFNIITDEHEKWDLLKHDLTLTCQIPMYQTYTISIEPDCAYRADKERFARAIKTYASAVQMVPNGLIRQQGITLPAPDLRRRIQGVVDEVQGSFPAPGGYGSVSSPTEAETLADVLTSTQVEPEEEAPKAEEVSADNSLDFDSFFKEGE